MTNMEAKPVAALREVGRLLAFLKEPEPPRSLKDVWQHTRPVMMQVLNMAPKERSSAPCQEVVWEGADVDLGRLPHLLDVFDDCGVGILRHDRAQAGHQPVEPA